MLRSDYLVYQLLPKSSGSRFVMCSKWMEQPFAIVTSSSGDLFARGSTSIADQETKIAAASARYNLGTVYRTIDRPTFAFSFPAARASKALHLREGG